MADLKTTNIYGDAYINNKVGIATNAPATRLQIGQLSPTAATEGIQFGDDPGTRIYRSGAGVLTVSGSLIYPSATVSGTVTFPNTSNAGLTTTDGTALFRLDDIYGNIYLLNSAGGFYVDATSHNFRNASSAVGMTISSVGDVTATRYVYGTYVSTSDDVSTGNISHIVAKFGDNFHRSATAAKVAAFISGQVMNIGGNAATVTTNANLSGDVTSVGNTTTIANTVVTNAKLKEMGASTIKGNNSGTATTPSDLTPAQVATMLNNQTMNINGSSTSCTGNAVTATTATALTSMNISQFTNNSGYLTSAVTSLAGTTNRITVSGATGAVTLNLPQDIHTGASPTFAGLSLTSVSTTGATITNLTGAYQNTSVYDSAKTQSATPSRGIRAPASSIQFTDSYAIAPFYTYRSTGDWPVPYGIGWGTGGESSGIFQRYASNGSSFGDMIFYTGNDGYGAFSFRRHTWEGTAQLAAGSGELNTELFRVDWAGNLTMLGTLNGSANSATFYANNGSYGAWAINGTRNGWGGIEFGNNGVSMMMGSDTVGFHQNTNGWLFRVHNGSGFIYKGAWGGGTAATIYDTTNGNGVLLRAAGSPSGYGDWNTFGNATQTTNAITQEYFNVGIGSSTPNSNFPSVVSYRYGILTNLGSGADARAQIYISHAGDDLIFRGGWGTASWQTWNRCLTNINSPYAYNMNQYVRTTDSPTFADLSITGQYQIRNSEPTITLRDTDHRTAFIHVNSNIFYILTGGVDAARTAWGQVANGRWPMELNLSNNNATFGADVNAISFTGAGTGLTGTASSLTAGAVTNGFYTTGGQTIAGITYFSNGESINAYGIRGRFTNEYLHLYNKVGVGHPGGWGAGESSTPDKGLSTYGGLNIAYGDNGLSTFNGVIRANSNIRQGADLARPLANWSVAGTSTGMVIFSFPGNTGNYGMVHCVFDIYEYNSNTVSTVIVGGHNWSGAWYNTGANVIGRCGKSVRLGVKDSKFCVVFGGAASSWEYGTIVLRKIHNGGFYTGIMDMGGSFTTQQTTTESFSNISGDLRLLRTSADFIADGGVTGTSFSGAGTGLTGTASSLSIGGNAATATTLATGRAINGVSFNGSAAITVDGLNYSVNNVWLRENGDDAQFQMYGNSRTMIYRTDGNTNPHGGGGYAHIFYYGGSADANRMFIINTDGRLWSNYHGWLDAMSITGNAATAGGLAVHGGRNNEANKIVRTDSNGYIQAGWINTPSGDMADTQSINKIYCSDDDYVRYKGVADFKQQIGLTYKNSTPRSTSTTDTNYWTGMMGWGTTDFNTMITWGCGFIDSWASPGNSPGAGYTHFVGVQALHYTNGDTDGTDNYGYQLVAGSGVNSPLFLRVNWGSPGSWKTMLDSLNFNSYSPSLTGNGASGNWAINVTGNAATVTNGIYTTNYYAGLPLGKRRYRIHSADSTSLNSSITNAECGFTYGGSGEPTGPYIAFGGLGGSIDYSCQLVGAYSGGGNDFKIRTRNDDAASWNTWRTIVTDGNYTSYSPTLTGTGASGTWAISITGNAATVTNGLYTNSSLTAGNLSGTIPSGVLGNSTHYIGTTAITLNRTSSSQTLTGVSIDGNAATATSATSATYLNSSNYIARCGSSGNANTDFQNTPAGSVRHNGDDSNLTNSPGGTWWFYDNYRHSNNSNYWGIQVAWGWEDQANKLATRNITGGTFGGWVYYLNSGNYTSYSPTLTGTGASGTWGINITGNAATATTATNVTIANGSVTLAKIENITAYTILGNSNASAAATPAALSVATVATMLSGQTMNINGSSTSISGFGNPTTAASANTIAYRDGSGHITGNYIFGSYLNSSDDVSTGNISHIMAKFGDNYHRSATAAKVAAFITGQTMNINGSSTSCSGNAATATSISGYNNPATGASANSIAYRDGNADLTTRYFMANRSSAGAGQCGVQLQTSGTTKWWMYLRQSDDNVLAFYTSNATADDVVRMSSTGLGIKVDPSNRLHVNGDGTNPAIRVDNGAVVLAASAASNSKTFYGWLPISIAGTTKWIQMYN